MNLAFLLTFIFLILIFLYDVLKKRNSGNFKSKFLIIIIILLFLFELYNRLGEPKTEHFLSGGIKKKLKYSIIEPQEYTAKPKSKSMSIETITGNNDNTQSTKNIFSIIYDYNPFSVSYGDYEDTGSNFLVGYGFSLGDYDASVGYSSFSAEAASGLEDEDGLFFTVGASF